MAVKVETREVKALALKQEQGRRRKNKARPEGEKVKAKAFYLAALSGAEIASILEGEAVTKTYGSGRKERLVLAAVK